MFGAKPYVPWSLCGVSRAGGTWDLLISRVSRIAIGLCPRTHTITDLRYFTDIFIRGEIGAHRLLLPANIESQRRQLSTPDE